jgi:hypothetical protein
MSLLSSIETSMEISAAKKAYQKSGNLNDISDSLMWLKNQGYSTKDIASKLNMPESDITNAYDCLASGKEISNPSQNINYAVDDVFGLPFRFNSVADPRRRIYNNTFMADAPILSLIVGTPEFKHEDSEVKDIDLSNAYDDDEDSFASEIGLDLASVNGITSWLLKSQKDSSLVGNKDLRYYHFKQNYDEYLKYIDRLVTTLGVKMGIDKTVTSINDYIKTTWEENKALKFYCSRDTSVSESLSNEYSGSSFVSTVNNTAATMQEVKYLTQDSSSFESVESAKSNTVSDVSDTVLDKVDDLFSSLLGSSNSVSNITNSVKQTIKGYNLYYPDFWKGSSSSQSFSTSMTFVSPYGDPASIFEYVYVPFLTLFCMASARQTGYNAYTSPFILQVDMPGCFTSDCAVITSMSWQKGGSDNLWSVDGLPLAIKVDLQFKDLYPILIMSKSWGGLRLNNGIHGYLDNMAGLAINRYTWWEDVKRNLEARTNYLLGTFNRKFQSYDAWLGRITHV